MQLLRSELLERALVVLELCRQPFDVELVTELDFPMQRAEVDREDLRE
jgi:hypothetical protein